ncbi:MAG: Mrp/NBP35 family ATP-binding protein [Actinomycetota bacterium]
MEQPTREQITEALGKVIDPELKRPVTELDMVREVHVEGGKVAVTIALTVAGCPLRSSFEDQVNEHVLPLPGVDMVSLAFEVMSPDERAALTAKLRGSVTGRSKGISVDASTRVLAVASGKGGVGKSTLSVNLAAAFDRLGQRTGILDADVYGHSIPHMLGVTQRPVVVDKMIVPPVRGDLKLMSIGFFLDENAPVMWRGPMLHRALEQFLSDVHWGELDTLVVDMPPGTGDVSISLGQLLPRAEAVVVTTPQPAAQLVAVRAAQMAQKTGMRLIGAVENMSYLVGTGQELFGAGGGEALAGAIDAPLLGRIPFDPSLRESADSGEPLVWANPENETARTIVELAEAITATGIEPGRVKKPLPLVS